MKCDAMHKNQERHQIITLIFGMNGLEILNRLIDLQKLVLKDKELLITENQSWNVKTDARITSIIKLFSSLGRTRLELEFLSELLDDDWWQAHSPESTQEMKIDHLKWHESLTKYTLGMDFFTCVEASFRIFLRALDPKSCKNGTGEFKNVYECLLGPNHLDFKPNERTSTRELLDLSRIIRNLQHNNGVFFSNDLLDKTMKYKGISYTFWHGKRASFIYWALLLEILDDLRKLLITVISHPKILSIPHIPDPLYA